MLRFRLHTKFLTLILGSLVVLLGLFSYIVVEREARLLAGKGVEKQRLLADAMLADLKQSMITGRPRNTLDVMKNLESSSGLMRLKALRRDGTPAFGVRGKRVDIPQLGRMFQTGREIDYPEPGDPPVHTILLPLKNEGECLACHKKDGPVLGAIMVSLSMADTATALARSRRDLTVMLVGLILFIGGILYLLLKKVILSPLAILHQGAESIRAGNLSHRIDLKTNDELQSLAAAFNRMTTQIEESHAGLENRIAERTAKLEQAMAEVREKAGRLYAFGRDMATITRLSTRVFNTDLSEDELLDRFMGGVTRGLGYRRVMLCLVDKKNVWLEIRRDSGVSVSLRFRGQSLLNDAPLARLVRSGKVAVLEGDDPAFGAAEPGRPAHFVIPLLNRTHARPCWELTSCIKTDCPAHRNQSTPCWLQRGTLCGNSLIESFGNKLAYCATCKVFPVIGALVVAADRPHRSGRGRGISVLRILAAAMSSALENQRLHEDNRQMMRQLLELHRVTAAALSELSLTKALEIFADSALKFSGMVSCTFWLASPDGRELVRKAGDCIDEDTVLDSCPERLPLDRGLLSRAFHQNAFVVDYDVVVNDDTALSRAAAEHGLNSLLAIPLKSERGPIGVFAVHKREALPFLESNIAALMLLAGQAAMAISACQLSEELKGQNRELARHTNLLSGILSSMSSGVMLLDAGTSVMLVNVAGASILRSRRENLMNRRLADLFPGAAAFTRLPDGSQQETELRLQDGASVPIGFSSAYYQGAGGDHAGIIVVYQDLSEIKSLQAELLNKERFAAMGRVVAGVAHEVRNPLFGISSVGQILERELQDPAHLELVRALLSETKRMNQLVEELLLYGRPMKLRLETCNLSAIWQEVLGMHRDELERRGVRLSGASGIAPVTAHLDANQIRQVFLNLLRNAIDATRPGGEVGVRMLLEDRFIIFKINDTGVGIPAENLDRIFDLFFTTKPKGTGLGLAICKKIVQDHGGDIAVQSEAGKGTAVTIKLPYRGGADA